MYSLLSHRINIEELLENNGFHIPNQYYQRMLATGLIDQLGASLWSSLSSIQTLTCLLIAISCSRFCPLDQSSLPIEFPQ